MTGDSHLHYRPNPYCEGGGRHDALPQSLGHANEEYSKPAATERSSLRLLSSHVLLNEQRQDWDLRDLFDGTLGISYPWMGSHPAVADFSDALFRLEMRTDP